MCEAEVDGWKGFLDVAATSGVESTASSSTQSRRIQISASPQHVKNNILQLYLIEVDVFFQIFPMCCWGKPSTCDTRFQC